MVRAICERASQALGQQMLVDARPGGGTKIGTEAIRRAAKDGYTIGVMVSASGVNIPALDPKAGYDPINDFTLLTLGFEAYFAIVANPKHGWRTLGDLLAASRAKPDAYTYGTSGVGTSSHIWPAVFQSGTGVRWLHVPYKGEALAMQDLLGGTVDLMFAGVGQAKPHVDAGRLVALAVTAPERQPLMPGVPTADEQGVRNFVAGGWISFIAPAGIPPEVAERLSRVLRDAINTPEVRDRLAQAGFRPRALPPDALAAQIRRELDLVRATGKAANIVLE
jgi:tripartite-type tricarboxylate transporter receptor subunit TctC